ncbi:hypothetical protein GGS24DRAFT_503117 [Hypoxylon argillaceum]|nr:hypothetical protein GGS24DRAFT_503117 [Hypoxylon argillaceum]
MNRGFRPTDAALERNAGREPQRNPVSRAQLSMNWRQPTPAIVQEDSFQLRSMPSNYRGNPTVASNHSAAIPDAENTSLWVTGLPRECSTYSNLLDLLNGRGKILATSIAAPSDFHGAAATVTFFRHVDAKNTMQAINSGILRAPLDCLPVSEYREPTLIDCEPTKKWGGFRRFGAQWNRVRVAEWKFPRAHQAGFQPPSRVIRVRGLAEHVRPGSLELYFKTRFCYNLDRIIFRGSYEYGVEEYEYRFASWKNQAEFAVMALTRERPAIKVWYGTDPCEVVDHNLHLLDKDDQDMKIDIPVLEVTGPSVYTVVKTEPGV